MRQQKFNLLNKFGPIISLWNLLIISLGIIAGIFFAGVITGEKWIPLFTALLTPMIAIVGTAITIFQWKTNERRFQHELFNRRIKLYETIAGYLAQGVRHSLFTNDEEVKFLRDTKHARFIFSRDIADFVDEIYDKSIKLTLFENDSQRKSGAEQNEAIKKHEEIFLWFQTELSNIQNRFEKYLQL